MKEIWKNIIGYEGLYQISNLGRVKSLRRLITNQYNSFYIKEKILKPQKNRYGYLYINLYKNGIMKHITIHKLVAEAFISIPDELKKYIGTRHLQVNHKDEDKTNNIYTNLEWCSASYNTNYGTRNKKAVEKLSKIVLQYDLNGDFIKEWKSVTECRRNGFKHVDDVCRGERKSCGGYIWKYK